MSPVTDTATLPIQTQQITVVGPIRKYKILWTKSTFALSNLKCQHLGFALVYVKFATSLAAVWIVCVTLLRTCRNDLLSLCVYGQHETGKSSFFHLFSLVLNMQHKTNRVNSYTRDTQDSVKFSQHEFISGRMPFLPVFPRCSGFPTCAA